MTFINIRIENASNKPKIALGYNRKITITILGSKRKYYVIELRNIKMKITNLIFGSINPREFTLIIYIIYSMGTWS